ncbi:MAG: hypothetical protein JNK56_14560 [Myxococcales bacterium]|nr:hypothetical protein [Myxococcales bacterium]
MLLNRHRVLRLIELAELERRVIGPERMLREEDVALLVKAAYDDATDLARAEFLGRVRPMPTSAWPWSAVQAMTPRSGNARSSGGANGVFSPAPGVLAPAALVLLRGQADGADADPGNRVPDRGQPDAAAWEPLLKALDLWDTATIKRWIGPQGWVAGGMATSQTTPGGVSPNTGGAGGQPNGGEPNGGGQPNGGAGQAETSPPTAMPFSWRHPAVIATSASVVTTVGVTLYALRSRRRRPVPLAAPTVASSPTTTGTPTGAVPRPSEEPT